MSKNTSNTNKVQKFTKAASGASTQFPANVAVNLLGQSYTPAQISNVFTGVTTALSAIAALKAQLATQLSAFKGTESTANELYAALKQYVTATFGKGSPVLQAFGFIVTTPKQPSSETKAKAAALRRQTRKARGTVGKKAKLAITTTGSPGLQLVGPDGQPIAGAFPPPVAPATAPAPSTGPSSTTGSK